MRISLKSWMKYRIEVLKTFKREFKRLYKRYPSLRTDIEILREQILEDPNLGTDLGGGLRKIRLRISSKGRGKSGGARVITFTVVLSVDESEIDLVYIYDKAERESVSDSELMELLRKSGLK